MTKPYKCLGHKLGREQITGPRVAPTARWHCPCGRVFGTALADIVECPACDKRLTAQHTSKNTPATDPQDEES